MNVDTEKDAEKQETGPHQHEAHMDQSTPDEQTPDEPMPARRVPLPVIGQVPSLPAHMRVGQVPHSPVPAHLHLAEPWKASDAGSGLTERLGAGARPSGAGSFGALSGLAAESAVKKDPEPSLSRAEVEARCLDTLREIYDPEIPVNLYDLGLIYRMESMDDAMVEIDMTLTAPACPVAGAMVQEVADKVGALPGVRGARVFLVWDPPWTKDRMSDEAKLELGLD